MLYVFSTSEPNRLARAVGVLALAQQERNVKTVAITTAKLVADLDELKDDLQTQLATVSTKPIEIRCCPGLLTEASAPAAVQAADAALLVVLAGRSESSAVKLAVENIKKGQTDLLGTVLVNARNPVPRLFRRLLGVA